MNEEKKKAAGSVSPNLTEERLLHCYRCCFVEEEGTKRREEKRKTLWTTVKGIK